MWCAKSCGNRFKGRGIGWLEDTVFKYSGSRCDSSLGELSKSSRYEISEPFFEDCAHVCVWKVGEDVARNWSEPLL